MKRADRLLQIEKNKRDVNSRLGNAIEAGKQPLAMIMKYPAITLILSATVAGMLTRRVLVKPLPAPLKLLAIPLARRLVRHTLLRSPKL